MPESCKAVRLMSARSSESQNTDTGAAQQNWSAQQENNFMRATVETLRAEPASHLLHPSSTPLRVNLPRTGQQASLERGGERETTRRKFLMPHIHQLPLEGARSSLGCVSPQPTANPSASRTAPASLFSTPSCLPTQGRTASFPRERGERQRI